MKSSELTQEQVDSVQNKFNRRLLFRTLVLMRGLQYWIQYLQANTEFLLAVSKLEDEFSLIKGKIWFESRMISGTPVREKIPIKSNDRSAVEECFILSEALSYQQNGTSLGVSRDVLFSMMDLRDAHIGFELELRRQCAENYGVNFNFHYNLYSHSIFIGEENESS